METPDALAATRYRFPCVWQGGHASRCAENLDWNPERDSGLALQHRKRGKWAAIYGATIRDSPGVSPLMDDEMLRQFFFGGRQPAVPQERREQSLGSGVIVSEDGYVLTNNHVIENAEEIKVALPDNVSIYDAKVVGTDPQTDIAVLKVDAGSLPAITVADIAEILNNLPEGYEVVSVTTDGFITDAPQSVVEDAATKGPLGQLFLAARQMLIPGTTSYLELKHQVRQVLAWRTRGQATVEGGDGESCVLLAKAGLSVPESRKDDPNDYIVEKFINRDKEDLKDPVERFRSLAEIYNSGGRYDLNKRIMWITTSMEFDWKRLRSTAPGSMSVRPIRGVDHVYFNTRPLPSPESYQFVRERWSDFVKKRQSSKSVLMTPEDVESFESYLSVSPVKGLGVGREPGAQLKVTRQCPCRRLSR